jgi:cob(I)alamin adenosyltransferase
MKIYTRTGDQGETSIIGGRVSKDDLRIEAYGTIDELNSFAGQAISLMKGQAYTTMKQDLIEIQHELFDCGADLAVLKEGPKGYKISKANVERLEQWIDRYESETSALTKFILPGGTAISSLMHVCRTVCRRAERRVVSLSKDQTNNAEVRHYLNRLSDLFFTLARAANVYEGVEDVEYIRSAEVFKTKP